MSAELGSDLRFEIGHVLFMDIVGYSKLLIDEQRERIRELKEIVCGTKQVSLAEAEGKLTRLPTGDGMALVFRNTLEVAVQCALEISEALRTHPELRLRMGVHSGPVSEVTDVNERANIAGAGINIAQRVMDCGDAGHILLSRHAAEDLSHYRQWQPYLHDLGECEVKHGVTLSVVNFYKDQTGNPEPPARFKGTKRRFVKATVIPAAPHAVRPIWIAVWFAAASILIAGFWIFSHRGQVLTSGTPNPPIAAKTASDKSIAVLPFENLSHDPDNAYFAEGIQEEILTRLSKVADLKVISRTSTQRYQNKPDNLPEIAKQLGVANILEGSVQRAADRVRVNVQLINARNDSHLWADKFDRKLTDIFAVESEIAAKIADTLQAKLTAPERHAIATRPTENSEAHDLYLKGRYHVEKYTEEGIRMGIAYFQQAIDLDPNYAPAYSGIAYAHFTATDFFVAPRESMPKARKAAGKALELDDALPEAHMEMGMFHFMFDFDWPSAERELRRAIELAPNYAIAHGYFGWYLISLARVEEGIAESKRAKELDPLSAETNSLVGQNYYFARRYDLAIDQLRSALELDPTWWFSHFSLGLAYQGKGDYSRAIAELEQARTLESSVPWTTSALSHAYAIAVRKQEAERLLNELLNRSTHGYVPGYNLAEAYVGLGEKDKALAALEKGYDDRSLALTFLKDDPRFDSLRSEPRFKDLLRRIGLSE